MYNKYIFINNNRRKKQKELEEKKKQEEPQISFDMLVQENLNTNSSKVKKTEGKVNTQNIIKRNNLMRFVDNYVLVDIETTGLSPMNDEIIEIGAIKIKENKIVDKYNELIKINRKLEPFITNLTGITDEMLETGKNPTAVFQNFVEFVGEDIIIGHNVNFDLGFLTNKCKKYINYNLTNECIDTMYLAKKLVPNSINYKLGTLAKYFNISYEGAHRGLKDVEITYAVYNCLRNLV